MDERFVVISLQSLPSTRRTGNHSFGSTSTTYETVVWNSWLSKESLCSHVPVLHYTTQSFGRLISSSIWIREFYFKVLNVDRSRVDSPSCSYTWLKLHAPYLSKLKAETTFIYLYRMFDFWFDINKNFMVSIPENIASFFRWRETRQLIGSR